MIQSVNLYPEDLRPRHERVTLPRVVTGALIILLLLVLVAVYGHWRAGQAELARVETSDQLDQLQASLTEASARLDNRTRDPQLEAELTQLDLDLRTRTALLERLQRLARDSARGFSPVLAGLSRQAVDGVWLTGVEIGRQPDQLVLEGMTRDGSLVPYYLQLLRSEDAFAGHGFRHFRLDQVEDNPGVLRFRVATSGEGDQ